MLKAPSRFDLLVFDWDGTLVDSAAAIVASLQAACRDVDLPVPDEERARYVIGLGLADALAWILPGVDAAHYPRVTERYRHHFLQVDGGIRLFDGAADLLAELHAARFRLAIATGKSQRGLARALETTGLKPYFHATRCADQGFAKPHPGMLEALLDELAVPAERALMIGDTSHDMEMARAAAVAGLGVGWGAHPVGALVACGPLGCVHSMQELREWLALNA